MREIHGIDLTNMYPSDKLKILLLERIAKALEEIAKNKGEKNEYISTNKSYNNHSM